MARSVLRSLALTVALVLAGVPLAATVCDLTCASSSATVPAASAAGSHHHAATNAVEPGTGGEASDPAAHAHHHHATGDRSASTEQAHLRAAAGPDDCTRDGQVSALVAAPRHDGDADANQQVVAPSAAPAAPSETPGRRLSRHGSAPARSSFTAPLSLRI